MKRAARVLAMLVAFVALSGCDILAGFFAAGEDAGQDRPRVPAPVSYIAEVPSTSDELVVATVPLGEFVPTVTDATDAEGNDLVVSPVPERVLLTDNGNPARSPVFNGAAALPLENTPYLQLVRYWRRLGAVQRYSGATTTSTTRSYTRGSKRTETYSFGVTIGVSVGVEADALFASTSVTLSAEFSGEFEEETEISESVTETNTFEVAAAQDENIVFTVWQLVDEYRIVADGPGATWIPYEDPHYTFLAEDLAPLVVPTTEVIKYSWAFDNAERLVAVRATSF